MSLEMFPVSECACDICHKMCHAPCTGTPEEIDAIIEGGYGHRLCLDDWPNQVTDIHPALKGYEGGKAPFATRSEDGCTFWIHGKCELHNKGLKPLGGKFAHHALPDSEWEKFCSYNEKAWDSEKGRSVIEKWKERFLKDDN